MTRSSLEWVSLSTVKLTGSTVVLGAVALGAVVAACSSARNDVGTHSRQDDPTNEEEAPATLEAFYSRYAELTCEYFSQCYGAAVLGTYCDADGPTLEAYYGPSVATLVYHREDATRCLATLRNAQCEGLFVGSIEEGCQHVIEGAGKANDSCTGALDCGFDLYCKDDEQCPGVCLPRKAAGEACDTYTACLEGLTCATSECSPPAGEGEDCSSLPCGSGLWCIDDVCKPYQPYQRQLGESCESSSDCYGLEYCDLETNTCVAAGREGDDCTTIECYFGYYCSESVCRARKANGETCVERIECRDGTCTDGLCQAPREIGEDCTEPLECRSVSCGKNGKCLPLGSCD